MIDFQKDSPGNWTLVVVKLTIQQSDNFNQHQQSSSNAAPSACKQSEPLVET